MCLYWNSVWFEILATSALLKCFSVIYYTTWCLLLRSSRAARSRIMLAVRSCFSKALACLLKSCETKHLAVTYGFWRFCIFKSAFTHTKIQWWLRKGTFYWLRLCFSLYSSELSSSVCVYGLWIQLHFSCSHLSGSQSKVTSTFHC